jgi:hypothetical protein
MALLVRLTRFPLMRSLALTPRMVIAAALIGPIEFAGTTIIRFVPAMTSRRL